MSDETISKVIIALVGPFSAFAFAWLQRRFMQDQLASKEFVQFSFKNLHEFWSKFVWEKGDTIRNVPKSVAL